STRDPVRPPRLRRLVPASSDWARASAKTDRPPGSASRWLVSWRPAPPASSPARRPLPEGLIRFLLRQSPPVPSRQHTKCAFASYRAPCHDAGLESRATKRATLDVVP